MRKIEELERDLADRVQENQELLPKMEMLRDGEKKKEREEFESMARGVDAERMHRDDERHKHQAFIQKKDDYDKQLQLQNKQLSQYQLDNKKELTDFMRNENALLEYQTLTFKQSKKIKELRDEIEQLNKKFPEEVSKYTKEIEFLKFDNENKRSELEFGYQSNMRSISTGRPPPRQAQGVEDSKETNAAHPRSKV